MPLMMPLSLVLLALGRSGKGGGGGVAAVFLKFFKECGGKERMGGVSEVYTHASRV